jgi:multiple sugar transport system permease protein
MAVPERTTGTPQPIGFSRSVGGRIGLVLRWIALFIAVVLFLLPFYLILRNALSTEADITAPDWTLFPKDLQWGNISELFKDTQVPMARSLYNSAVVGVLGTAGQLLLASMAGYGLARIPYKHADKVFYAIVATLMIPGAVTFIPSFIVVSSLGWVSSLRGLIIPTLFSGFAAFLFRQYFLNFPRELEEAARVDGAGHFGVFPSLSTFLETPHPVGITD